MKAKIRDGWADRLESGEYPQATGVLRESDTHRDGKIVERGRCCLGVLCDYAIQEGVPMKWDGANYLLLHDETSEFCDEDCIIDDYGKHWREWGGGELPQVVVDWAGLDDENPVLDSEQSRGDAVNLNDNEGYDFGQIAALVRQYPVED
jgi:hypothetical protein